MKTPFKKFLVNCWLPVARRAAQSYIAGPELADAMRACHWLSEQEFTSTICFWDSGVEKPEEVAAAYCAAIDKFRTSGIRYYLSVKAPALKFDPTLVTRVLNHAKSAGVRLHFDSHAMADADQTLALISQALPEFAPISCTIPGRWHRSLQDADWAADRGVIVRVVKGQWVDPEHRTIDPTEGFLAVIDRLAGKAGHVAVATHDQRLAREALRRLRLAGTSCELELLLGLPIKPGLRIAGEAGVPVRIYVPYGHAWLPYALSQAQRNPRIMLWVLRDILTGRTMRLPTAVSQADKRLYPKEAR